MIRGLTLICVDVYDRMGTNVYNIWLESTVIEPETIPFPHEMFVSRGGSKAQLEAKRATSAIAEVVLHFIFFILEHYGSCAAD